MAGKTDKLQNNFQQVLLMSGKDWAMIAALESGVIAIDDLPQDLKELVLMYNRAYNGAREKLRNKCLAEALGDFDQLQLLIELAQSDLCDLAYAKALSVDLPFEQCLWLLDNYWTEDQYEAALFKATGAAQTFDDHYQLFYRNHKASEAENELELCFKAADSLETMIWVMENSRAALRREVEDRAFELADKVERGQKFDSYLDLWHRIRNADLRDKCLAKALANAADYDQCLQLAGALKLKPELLKLLYVKAAKAATSVPMLAWAINNLPDGREKQAAMARMFSDQMFDQHLAQEPPDEDEEADDAGPDVSAEDDHEPDRTDVAAAPDVKEDEGIAFGGNTEGDKAVRRLPPRRTT